LRLRATVYEGLDQPEKELADLDRLLEMDPEDVKVRRTALDVAMALGRFPEAESHCRQLLTISTGNKNLRLKLAGIQRSRGNDEVAVQTLDALLRDFPNDARVMLDRGILYTDTGQPELAVILLRQVFEREPSRQVAYPLFLALTKAGRATEAEQIHTELLRLQDVERANDAIKTQPGDPDLHYRQAEGLFQAGHTADGLKLLEALAEKSPNYAPAHLRLAEAYEKQGRPELAAKHRRLAGHGP
jgi:predicted Zn-dependent protease